MYICTAIFSHFDHYLRQIFLNILDVQPLSDEKYFPSFICTIINILIMIILTAAEKCIFFDNTKRGYVHHSQNKIFNERYRLL